MNDCFALSLIARIKWSMGPQFAHIETYSVKQSKAGNSVEQVLGEAMRDPQFSAHIETALPPDLIFGVDIPRLKELHASMLAGNTTPVIVKGKVRNRAIRQDRNTLMTVVSSYPVSAADIFDDETGEARRLFNRWVKLNVEFLKSQFGSNLKTVIGHSDEEYPHIHAYVLPENIEGVYADQLHVGKVAKALGADIAIGKGLTGTDVTKLANKDYRAAMARWQDDFYMKVGEPSGLTRDGPKRARLSRSQWQADKAKALLKARVLEDDHKRAAQFIQREKALKLAEEANMMKATANRSKENALAIKSMAQDAFGKELKVREEQVSRGESLQRKLQKTLVFVNSLIGDIANYLGISPTLQSIADRIEADLLLDEEPEDTSPSL